MTPLYDCPNGNGRSVPPRSSGRAPKWEWLWKKNHVCPWWLAYTFDLELRNRLHPPRRILGPFVKPGMTALDVGCGAGFFSLALARMVGPQGTVLSADIQKEMLAKTQAKASGLGLGSRVRPLLLEDDCLKLPGPIDFALAFWMAHEVRDLPLLLGRIHHYLKPGGRFLLVEPLIHVSKKRFSLETVLAMETGLTMKEEPPVRFSRAAVFQKT